MHVANSDSDTCRVSRDSRSALRGLHSLLSCILCCALQGNIVLNARSHRLKHQDGQLERCHSHSSFGIRTVRPLVRGCDVSTMKTSMRISCIQQPTHLTSACVCVWHIIWLSSHLTCIGFKAWSYHPLLHPRMHGTYTAHACCCTCAKLSTTTCMLSIHAAHSNIAAA